MSFYGIRYDCIKMIAPMRIVIAKPNTPLKKTRFSVEELYAVMFFGKRDTIRKGISLPFAHDDR